MLTKIQLKCMSRFRRRYSYFECGLFIIQPNSFENDLIVYSNYKLVKVLTLLCGDLLRY